VHVCVCVYVSMRVYRLWGCCYRVPYLRSNLCRFAGVFIFYFILVMPDNFIRHHILLYTHPRTHTHTYTYTYIYTHAHAHTYPFTYMYVHTHTKTHTKKKTRTCVYIYMFTRAHGAHAHFSFPSFFFCRHWTCRC
jgi:hypothetical protein